MTAAYFFIFCIRSPYYVTEPWPVVLEKDKHDQKLFRISPAKEAGEKPAFGGYASSRLGEVRYVSA
jgi:hypothetical protein